jgi:hypothetical protein
MSATAPCPSASHAATGSREPRSPAGCVRTTSAIGAAASSSAAADAHAQRSGDSGDERAAEFDPGKNLELNARARLSANLLRAWTG